MAPCSLFTQVLFFFVANGSAAFLGVGWDASLPFWLISLYISWGLTTVFAFLPRMLDLPSAREAVGNIHATSNSKEKPVDSPLTLCLKGGVFGTVMSWSVTGWVLVLTWDKAELASSAPVMGLAPEVVMKIKGWIIFFHAAPAMVAWGSSFGLMMVGGWTFISRLVSTIGKSIYVVFKPLDRVSELPAEPKHVDQAETEAMLPHSAIEAAEEGRVLIDEAPPSYSEDVQERALQQQTDTMQAMETDEIAYIVARGSSKN